MPRNQQFEIPQELRQLAEENVERARKLYLQFMEGVSQAMGAWSTPTSNEASPGFNEVRERAIKITRENADAAFNLARDVANAKDLQELVTLQTRYVQSQMKWYAQQTQEFGRLMAKALGGAQSSTPGPDQAGSESTAATAPQKEPPK
jgi:phasin